VCSPIKSKPRPDNGANLEINIQIAPEPQLVNFDRQIMMLADHYEIKTGKNIIYTNKEDQLETLL
jgi:hypothetical protein